jgi:hypothetical protein
MRWREGLRARQRGCQKGGASEGEVGRAGCVGALGARLSERRAGGMSERSLETCFQRVP